MSNDPLGLGIGKSDRRFYLTGPKKGQVRHSRKTRAEERKIVALLPVRSLGDARRTEGNVLDSPVESAHITSEKTVSFVLGPGVRMFKDGVTEYCLDADSDACQVASLEWSDVESGRRYFRQPFPLDWMREYTAAGRQLKASQGLYDYGKEFVEVNGCWHEALEVGKLDRRTGWKTCHDSSWLEGCMMERVSVNGRLVAAMSPASEQAGAEEDQ